MKKLFFVLTFISGTCLSNLFAEVACFEEVFPPSCNVCSTTSTVPVNMTPSHPLDPLTPGEQCAAVQAVTTYIQSIFTNPDPKTFFDRVELLQPSKASVLAFAPGNPIVRKAFVAVYSQTNDAYYTAQVNLSTIPALVDPATWTQVPGARPSWTNADNYSAFALLNNDPTVRSLLLKYVTAAQIDGGFVFWCVANDGRLNNLHCANKDDLSQCQTTTSNGCGQCTTGMPCLETSCGQPKRPRAFFAMPYLVDSLSGPLANYYLQPIGGIIAWLDMNAGTCGEILQVSDTYTGPSEQQSNLINFNCAPNAYYDNYRGTLQPLFMNMPTPSYTINGGGCQTMKSCPKSNSICGSGNEVIWENWKIRFSMHPTWGLQLHLVQFKDVPLGSSIGTYRSILYQANLAEVLTLYGESGSSTHQFLDFGEYQTRLFITPLQRGVDVPPYATMLSPVFVQETGLLFQFTNSLAIYEQDGGVLWRHYDPYNGIFQGRRGRELVFTHTNSVGNYDYAFYWIFKQDGKIDVKVRLTGLDEYATSSQKTVPPDVPNGALAHPFLKSPNHQHVFAYRLDFDIDGQQNNVYETNITPVTPGVNNPCSNLWSTVNTLLPDTHSAARNISTPTGRTWLFANPNSFNSLGQMRGYQIEPFASAVPTDGACARMMSRATFLQNHFWVTPHQDDQYNIMSKFPVEQGTDAGPIAFYKQNNTSITDTDVVAWYHMIFSHDPQPENFPVLPVEEVGFSLVPVSFFDHNPAVDIDPNGLQCSSSTNCKVDAQTLCP